MSGIKKKSEEKPQSELDKIPKNWSLDNCLEMLEEAKRDERSGS